MTRCLSISISVCCRRIQVSALLLVYGSIFYQGILITISSQLFHVLCLDSRALPCHADNNLTSLAVVLLLLIGN